MNITSELTATIRQSFKFGRKAEEWSELPVSVVTPGDEFMLEELESFDAPLELGAPTESSAFYEGKPNCFILSVSDGPNKGEYLVICEGYDYARYAARIVRERLLAEAADKAEAIHAAHEEGASMDAGFDGGEFSGPAHWSATEREVRKVCGDAGVPYETVEGELMRRMNEACPER